MLIAKRYVLSLVYPFYPFDESNTMTEATENTSNTEATDAAEGKKAEIATIQQKMQEFVLNSGDMNSPEFLTMTADLAKLTKVKASKAIDPKLKEEQDSFKDYLGDSESGVTLSIIEKLNAAINEKYPLMAEKGISVESVKIKIKGLGRSSGEPRNPTGRFVHLTADGKRNKEVFSDAMPGLKKLIETYPEEEAEIMETFGTKEKRIALWESVNKDAKHSHYELADGTKLSIQS